ncbi:T9SS type A sorting domain-containing protein, partial [candidate division KSB1 bacterium]|nr:T9SS type A sorting domain-containing protein [candidate division KSB1 bacterium]
FDPPGAPADLVATANAESIQLEWSANPEDDVAGYTVFRAETSGGPYNTIARNVASTSFLDNSATTIRRYYYVIKAVDNSLNRSDYSEEVSATATNDPDYIAYFPFDGNLQDTSINLNHGASRGGITFAEGRFGSGALALNKVDAFVQLPSAITSQEEMTIACWVYWQGGTPLQRIFDFSNNENETMYLTASTGLLGGKMQFAIKNGGEEQVLNAPLLPFKEWAHVAITLNGNEARMYINSTLADESDAFSISPADFKPALNYIGRGQTSEEPLLNGRIDDFVLYNYALSVDEVVEIYTSGVMPSNSNDVVNEPVSTLSVWPVPANDFLHIGYISEFNSASTLSIFDLKGRLVYTEKMNLDNAIDLDVSDLSPGVYVLKLINSKESVIRKIIIE